MGPDRILGVFDGQELLLTSRPASYVYGLVKEEKPAVDVQIFGKYAGDLPIRMQPELEFECTESQSIDISDADNDDRNKSGSLLIVCCSELT
jgi:hypothetical protein